MNTPLLAAAILPLALLNACASTNSNSLAGMLDDDDNETEVPTANLPAPVANAIRANFPTLQLEPTADAEIENDGTTTY